jgi:anaerobic dimethyl sulfoxide reductase subunit C (anchor subunit)
MAEWPLAVFTVALQLACGLALAGVLLEQDPRASEDEGVRRLGISVFPVVLLGLLASLFHLGRPLSALRSLTNLPGSWISIEVLLTGLFAGAALLSGRAWWLRRRRGRLALAVTAAILGLAAVVASSLIYLMPAQPAWNSAWVPISFVGTSLLLGGVIPLCAGIRDAGEGVNRTLRTATVAGGVALLAAAVWMLARLARPSSDPYSTARLSRALDLVLADHGLWFALYLLLASVLPLVIAFRPARPASRRGRSGGLIVAAVLTGILIGRLLMYVIGTVPPPF